MTSLKEHLDQLFPSNSILSTEPENYDDVELTFEESQAAITEAKKEKLRKQKLADWHEKINAEPVWYTPTAKDFYTGLLNTVSQSGKPYQINEHNRNIIIQLCLYFSNDPRLGTDPKTGVSFMPDLSHGKGILLMGLPGTGKSHLMNFFAKNPKMSYQLQTCKVITQRYADKWSYEGVGTLEYYGAMVKAAVGHPWSQKELGTCFHDLGAERLESNSFGNKENVMETVIFNRYENKLPFKATHVTTNLDEKQIESAYGSRIRDRLREMFNVFVCNWESFR